jgi:hypothetical protein
MPLLVGILALRTGSTRAAEPIEEIVRLVPPDAVATLAVADLKGHARELAGSSLVDGLSNLAVVREWMKSDQFQGFTQACHDIEQGLGEKIPAIRDEIFGDAFTLSLHVPPQGGLEQARGLLITRVSNRALLDRVVKAFNKAQEAQNELAKVGERTHLGITYFVREFRPGGKPTEFYAFLAGDRFAWSNSEELIQGAISRSTGVPDSLQADGRFQAVRRRLPSRCLASLYVDPSFAARLIAASPSKPAANPAEERAQAMIVRYLSAVEYVGVALEWNHGIVLHTDETLNPAKLDPWIKHWAAGRRKMDTGLHRTPDGTLAAASVALDFGSLHDAISSLVSELGQAKFDNVFEIFRGLLLGREIRSAVLPNLGPGVLTYIEAPRQGESKPGPPLVLQVQVADSGIAEAFNNLLRTALSVYALDDNHGQGRLRLATRERNGTRVTALEPTSPIAFAVDRGRVVIASTPEAVARAFAAGPGSAFERFREAHFPGVESIAWVNLEAIQNLAHAQRTDLLKRLATQHQRSEDQEAHEVDQMLELVRLFTAAYITSEMAPDATSIHRRFGLVASEKK